MSASTYGEIKKDLCIFGLYKIGDIKENVPTYLEFLKLLSSLNFN